MNTPLHLVRRFFSAIRPGAPSETDEQWACSFLGEGEQRLWHQMNNPDRRHAVGVARAVSAELVDDATRPVIAAALLHDLGKIESGFRTPARVFATLFWAVVPHERADGWQDAPAFLSRLAQYRLHPELGEQLLTAAGADPLTSSWAADHHRPQSQWRIDSRLGSVLKNCDDD